MTTIGDSFSIVAILIGFGFTTWAMILAANLLFNNRASVARDKYQARPWQGFGLGVLIALTLGTMSVIISAIPLPIMKLVGMTGILTLLAVSSLGSAGLCQLIAQRIRTLEPSLSPYAALTRAAMLVVVASLFPILGWFLVGPVLLLTSLGIGAQSLLARAYATEVA